MCCLNGQQRTILDIIVSAKATFGRGLQELGRASSAWMTTIAALGCYLTVMSCLMAFPHHSPLDADVETSI